VDLGNLRLARGQGTPLGRTGPFAIQIKSLDHGGLPSGPPRETHANLVVAQLSRGGAQANGGGFS
jgi:hypothetical protein